VITGAVALCFVQSSAGFAIATIRPDRQLSLDLYSLSPSGMAVISERALVHMPQKRIENSNPQSAPRIPRFFGPRVEGLAISSDKRYIAALVRTPDAGADMRSPVSTIAVFRYPSLDHVKSVSAIVRVFPWQTERFLATYLSFGATHNWSTALDKTGRNWVEDRRGPSAEAKSLRSPSQVKWLKALLSKSNLQLTQVDLSYDLLRQKTLNPSPFIVRPFCR